MIAQAGPDRTGAPGAADVAASVASRADLGALLDGQPALATPALVRALQERVVELHMTDARRAREIAACAWLVSERTGDLESRALAHRARALAALASGWQREVLAEYEAAERLYREGGFEVERACVLRSMIDPLMHLGRYEEALEAGRRAREILRAHDRSLLAAQVDTNLANVHHRLGRDAESLDAYERALAVFREYEDHGAVAIVEFNRAHVFLERNELDEAGQGYRRARDWFRRQGQELRENQCRYALAYLAFVAGRYGEALRLYDQVRTTDLELGDERHAALCALDEAEVLLSLNAWGEARARAREAHGRLSDLGLVQEAARAILLEGVVAIRLDRPDDAVPALDEAASRLAAEGNDVLLALVRLYRAELALRLEEPRRAASLVQPAIATFADCGLRAKEAYARVVAGRALERLGRLRFARRQAGRALDALGRWESPGVAWRARHLLARLAPDGTERIRHLDAAIECVERLRSPILPDELLASYQNDKVELYDDRARAALEGTGGDPDVREALRIVETARARVLGDHLVRSTRRADGDRRPDLDASWRRRIEELQHCYHRLNEAERSSEPRSRGEPLRREIARRESDLAALHRRRHLASSPAGREPDDASEDVVRRFVDALEPGEVAVEYAFLGSRLHAFLVDPAGVRWLGGIADRSEVAHAVDRWLFLAGSTALGADHRAAHGEAIAAAARVALARLHDLLWAPVRDHAGHPQAVVVLPAGPLYYVPFHALWDGRSHLVEDRDWSYAPSGRILAAVRAPDRARRAAGPAIVLGHDPGGLPAIAREIEALRRRLPGASVRVGEEARRAELRDHGVAAPIVHLAAHATFRPDDPLLSSIEMADGRITFYDVFDLRLDADLVVLSGCQTGRSGILEGNELMGLARGFLYAGARSLVASHWPVDDDATARFMDRFYDRLACGRNARRALGGAMRELLEEGRLPHEWAAFHLTGRAVGPVAPWA